VLLLLKLMVEPVPEVVGGGGNEGSEFRSLLVAIAWRTPLSVEWTGCEPAALVRDVVSLAWLEVCMRLPERELPTNVAPGGIPGGLVETADMLPLGWIEPLL
jgi:hypothetical protein